MSEYWRTSIEAALDDVCPEVLEMITPEQLTELGNSLAGSAECESLGAPDRGYENSEIDELRKEIAELRAKNQKDMAEACRAAARMKGLNPNIHHVVLNDGHFELMTP